MKAYVICCNDSVEYVVLDDEEKANKKKEELAEKHFNSCKWSYKDYEEYRKLAYWHLHDVGCQ